MTRLPTEAAPLAPFFVLLFAVFFHVRFTGFLGVMRCMMTVTTGSMRVMGGLFVLPALMMFSGLCMVSCRVSMMFCCFFMVFGCFLGHGTVLWWVRKNGETRRLGLDYSATTGWFLQLGRRLRLSPLFEFSSTCDGRSIQCRLDDPSVRHS